MNTTLRLTDTNASADSSGRTWGLEGNLVWWLIGGGGSAMATFFALLVGLEASFLTSLGSHFCPRGSSLRKTSEGLTCGSSTAADLDGPTWGKMVPIN